MIFQKTLDQVLSGGKVQTSRLWKDDYTFPSDEYDREWPNVVLSMKAWEMGKIRRLYQVGQVLSVQPNRGQKGIAKIRVTELARRDVRNFTDEDIRREGFETRLGFYKVWYGMHFPSFVKLLEDDFVTEDWWLDSIKAQAKTHNDALVITFELLS